MAFSGEAIALGEKPRSDSASQRPCARNFPWSFRRPLRLYGVGVGVGCGFGHPDRHAQFPVLMLPSELLLQVQRLPSLAEHLQFPALREQLVPAGSLLEDSTLVFGGFIFAIAVPGNMPLASMSPSHGANKSILPSPPRSIHLTNVDPIGASLLVRRPLGNL